MFENKQHNQNNIFGNDLSFNSPTSNPKISILKNYNFAITKTQAFLVHHSIVILNNPKYLMTSKTTEQIPSFPSQNTVDNSFNYPQSKKSKSKKKSSFIQVILITITAFLISAFMICSLIFNIRFLHIVGTSMEPTLPYKAWVLSTEQDYYTYGDVISFYHNNTIMIKRIVALPGDIIDMDEEGNVYVNGKLIDEPYLTEKALGKPEIVFPYEVYPENYFVLGDNRDDSLDSRILAIGGIKSTDIIGKVSYTLIPYKKIS